jgi:hypothetical protein
MMIAITICALAFAYFTFFFFLERKRNRRLRGAKLASIANALGHTAVYGSIGAEKTLTSPFSGNACVYYSFTVEYELRTEPDNTPDLVGSQNIEKIEWVPMLRDAAYVPFFITDESGMKLSINPSRADFDIYPETNVTSRNLEADPELYRKLLPFIKPDNRILLKGTVRIREEFLKAGDGITVVSEVKSEETSDMRENIQIERELDEESGRESVFADWKWIYVDSSAPVTKYTTSIRGEKVYISDDSPADVFKSVRRKQLLNLSGAVASGLALVALAAVRLLNSFSRI